MCLNSGRINRVVFLMRPYKPHVHKSKLKVYLNDKAILISHYLESCTFALNNFCRWETIQNIFVLLPISTFRDPFPSRNAFAGIGMLLRENA